MIKKVREIKKVYEEGLFCECGGEMTLVQSSVITQESTPPMVECKKCGKVETLTAEFYPLQFTEEGEWMSYEDHPEIKRPVLPENSTEE